ncbi:MAG: hypothetical protein ACI8Z5_001108 [Lentimonas sp.]|jgi:hypothetical protein
MTLQAHMKLLPKKGCANWNFGNGNRMKSSITSVYADYRSINGMQEPYIVEQYLNDELQRRIVVEQADSNLGVVPWMF